MNERTISLKERTIMRQSRTVATGLAAFVVSGVAAYLAASPTAEPEVWQEMLRGTVEAAETADDGTVLRVEIDDAEWGYVLVAEEGRGLELMAHVGATVEATGQMQAIDDEEAMHEYVIVVEDFELLDQESDPEEDDPEDPGFD
jgi:hypothetical protein